MSEHVSVLLEAAVDGLAVSPEDVVVDATVGGAGHFSSFLQKIENGTGMIIGIDADEEALARAQVVQEKYPATTVHLVHDNFRNLDSILESLEVPHITKSLFDLGWSGYHLARGRGFSFQTNEPLLMTYGDPATQTTAEEVVNGSTEAELVQMLFELGEEQFARRIAKAIVEERKRERITTTEQLVALVTKATPAFYHNRRIHPATKTFQALRMEVNDELGALRQGLMSALERTAAEGRIAVITFHSIEDRIVKNIFRDAVKEGKGELVNKKPIIPEQEELSANPRARSAKLRIFKVV